MKLNHTNITAAIALFIILCALPSFGQKSTALDNITSLTDLASWLEKNPPEVVSLSGITGQRVMSESLTKLRQDVNQLQSYLNGNGEIGAKWAKVLFLDELRATVNQASPDLNTLDRIYGRFHSHQWGLEVTEIRQVAKGLNDYILLRMIIAEDIDLSDGLKEATTRLIAALKKGNKSSFDTTAEINEIVSWLEDNRQAPEVCQAVRRLTGKYNFYAQVSDKLVLKFLNRPVDQSEQVTEYIVGRPQSGRIRTVGSTSGKLNPDPDKINLSIILNAVASGNMVSQARNVTVTSASNNTLYVVKEIHFDGSQLTSPPARGAAQVRSTITGINSPGGLVQSAATNRVNEMKPQADAEATYKARVRAENAMNREVGALINNANARFRQTSELYRARGLYPDPFDCSTTEHALIFNARVSDGIPLIPQAAPSAPNNSDVYIAIHQSALMETCKTMLGDLKANQRVFMAIAQSMLPEDAYNELAKNAAKKQNNVPGGYVYFNADYPVNVEFNNNTITISIRFDGFQGKDSSGMQNIPMNLTTAYKIDKVDKNGVSFVRVKEPELVPRDFETGVRKLTTQETTLRNRLQGELKDSLPPSFLIQPRKLDELSDQSNPNAVKITGTLQPVAAKAANGWLTINWQLRD